MTRHVLRWGIALSVACCLAPRPAKAQGPTIDSGLPASPGSATSMLGSAPGAGGGVLGDNPGSGAAILGGRPGVSTPHVPTSITAPSSGLGVTGQQMSIGAPAPQPTPTAPLYGTLSLPTIREDEGPPGGMTLDMAIDLLLKENLTLRAQYYEIPQAQADVLQANLRANPVFYADGQLIPYGQYNRAAPGGPTQYDVNVSHPVDFSRKRAARTLVATRAKRVLEAQYQDAVRLSIDNLYQAFVDVLAARQVIGYSRESVKGLEDLLKVEKRRFELDQSTRAEVKRVEIQRDSAKLGLLDAQEDYGKKRRALAVLINRSPSEGESLEVRGTIFDRFPPAPPLEVLSRIALELRPDVASFRLGIGRAEADVRLAMANRYSDAYVLYQPYTFQNNQPFGLKSPMSWALGITVPVPIYNRNQGNIQRAKLNVTQTQIQLATLERQVLTDVAQAYREYTVTRKMVEDFEREILPDAVQVREDAYRLYTGGEHDVTWYLTAKRDFNDTVKQFLDVVTRHRRSMLSLNTVVGQRVMP